MRVFSPFPLPLLLSTGTFFVLLALSPDLEYLAGSFGLSSGTSSRFLLRPSDLLSFGSTFSILFEDNFTSFEDSSVFLEVSDFSDALFLALVPFSSSFFSFVSSIFVLVNVSSTVVFDLIGSFFTSLSLV